MNEIEIKFRVYDADGLAARALEFGFAPVTESTFERNALFDTVDGILRKKGEILRIRKYGEIWLLTHKAKVAGENGRHKQRMETETSIADGESLTRIFAQMGYVETFVYEKYRAEYAREQGHLVIDRTPIGTIAELEGQPEWIDRAAKELAVDDKEFIRESYPELFFQWKRETGGSAKNMTFAETGTQP